MKFTFGTDSEYHVDVRTDANLAVSVPMSINSWRRKRGLTQEQLANKCGMKQSTISRLEDLTYDERYSLTTLRRIASALDLELMIYFRESAAGRQK